MQAANVLLLLKDSVFSIRSLAGAVVKMEAKETAAPSFAFSLHFWVEEPPSAQT